MGAAKKQAVIYCRVSSAAQVKKGDGIQSQETRCREYARHKGYQVAEVFKDEGISGGVINRPGMVALLKFAKQQKHEAVIVIIDDISRLARGLQAHLELRTAIHAVGAKLESPSIEFGDDSDSQLVENLLASVSQHGRQKNAEQVKHRMRSRMMNGYWVFMQPVGYRYERVSGHGMMLVRNEPVASVVQEALESYASGRFASQGEVVRFLEVSPAFPRTRGKAIHYQKVRDMLERVTYAGYIDYPAWGIGLLQAKHTPLITFNTWQTIQVRLKETAQAPIRKDSSANFPLRGFIVCSCCETLLTACWAKGRNGKYPYYHCRQKGCPEYKKSTRKERIDQEFGRIVESLRPAPSLFAMAKEMLRALWWENEKRVEMDRTLVQGELIRIDQKIEQFLDRVVQTESSILLQTYENQIKKLEVEKITLSEKVALSGSKARDFDDALQTGFLILENPGKLWASERLEDKRLLLRLAFSKNLSYRRNEGFQTASLSLPFSFLEGLRTGDKGMVEATRQSSNHILAELEFWNGVVRSPDYRSLETTISVQKREAIILG